jgi:outer membrane protein TolC
VDNNSDLRSLDLATSQLEHALKVNKSQWWPTIMASYNFQYQTMGMNKMALKEYELFPVSNVGVSLSIPIFDGGARVHKDKQLQIQLDEQKDRRESLRQTLKMQILSSLDNIKKTLDKFESDKEGLRQAEKGMQIAQKRYEVGAGVYLDLTNSELAYIQAGLQYNQSIYDYLSAKADLEKLLGINTNIK